MARGTEKSGRRPTAPTSRPATGTASHPSALVPLGRVIDVDDCTTGSDWFHLDPKPRPRRRPRLRPRRGPGSESLAELDSQVSHGLAGTMDEQRLAAPHAVTDGRDRFGPSPAEHVRERRRSALHLGVAALMLEGVPRANTGGLEPDQNLSTAARGHRHLAFMQLLGAAEAVDHHGPHRGGLAGIRVRHGRHRPMITAPGRRASLLSEIAIGRAGPSSLGSLPPRQLARRSRSRPDPGARRASWKSR